MAMFVRSILLLILFFSVRVVSAQIMYDLKLSLQTARENNLILKAQYLTIGIAQSDVVTAGLRPNPALNNQSLQLLNSSYFPKDTRWMNGKNQQIWWQLTKPFQWPGQRQLKIRTAEYQLQVTEKEFTEKERNLYLEVASKWMEVWTVQKKLDILSIAKRNIDTLVRINEYRYQKQVVTETDLLRTQLLAKQFNLEIITARQVYINELKNLKFLLGVNDSITVDTSDSFVYDIPPGLDSLIQIAVSSRADIAAAQSFIDASTSNIALQRRLAFPQPEIGAIYNPQNAIPYAGIFATVEVPVFSRNQGEIKKSTIVREQARQNLYVLKTQAQIQVENSYYYYNTQKQNTANYQEILHQSQRILNNVEYTYMRGGTTIIDYLEAQRSWLETRQKYYDAMQQYKVAYLHLLFETGLINQLAF